VHAETSADLRLSYEAPVAGPEDPQALALRLERRLDEDFGRSVRAAAFETLRDPPAVPEAAPTE